MGRAAVGFSGRTPASAGVRTLGSLSLRPLAGRRRMALGMRLMIVAALAVAALLALPGAALALEQQKLVASDGAAGDLFGKRVAVDGDTAVVGAENDEGARGAVYVFTRTGDSWTQAAKLTASDGATGDRLGFSVAIDGDTIVAGANGDDIDSKSDQGSVYTFARTGDAARGETAKLTTSDGTASDRLGETTAIDGDTIVAGASGDNGSQGSVYTFASAGAAARSETARLTVSTPANLDELGSLSVGIDGDTIVAGAIGDDGPNNGQGAVYTFARTGAAARTETARLTASDGALRDFLGASVAIDGDTIVAGANQDDGPGFNQGSVYTFSRTGDAARTQTAKLTATDGASNDTLGSSVAIDGDMIVAGAPGDNGNQGSAYTFARAGAVSRTETARLVDSDGAASDFLGRLSVAIDGDTIIAGAFNDDVGANADQGSASIFFAPGAKSKLTVTKAGDGVGSVSSVPAGISCGFDCSEDYAAGTTVTLTASFSTSTVAGGDGSTFAGFSGCDATPSATTCTVTLDQAKSVTATFVDNPTLTVAKAGSGSGSVTSSPAGIDCGTDCGQDFDEGTKVTLTANAAAGSTFTGFTGGGCTGAAATCEVTMSQAQSVTAAFAKKPSAPSTPGPGPAPAPGRGLSPSAGDGLACPAGNSRGVKCTGRTPSGGLVIVGTKGDDTIVGTGKGDRITGGGGRDKIRSGGGNDSVSGGSGSDNINAGSGNDTVHGGSGDDRISGGAGRDLLLGGSGNDSLAGDSGRDRLSGDSGRDRLVGGSGKDKLSGGSGKDKTKQ